MYSVNGVFGEVRLVHSVLREYREALFSIYNAGWHRCNDLYCISRPNGNGSHLLLVTIDGCGEMEVSGVRYSLPVGTVALIPKGLPHRYGTPSGGVWEFYWIHPANDVAEMFADHIAENGVYVGKCDPSHPYVPRMESVLKRCATYSASAAIAVSHAVSDVLHFAAMDLREDGGRETVSERVIAYIQEHFAREISIGELASVLYLSEAHLIRVFKKETGRTPHRYILEYRLRMGAHLLLAGQLQISEIARTVGFSSSSQFISAFRRMYGCTPAQYREAAGMVLT